MEDNSAGTCHDEELDLQIGVEVNSDDLIDDLQEVQLILQQNNVGENVDANEIYEKLEELTYIRKDKRIEYVATQLLHKLGVIVESDVLPTERAFRFSTQQDDLGNKTDSSFSNEKLIGHGSMSLPHQNESLSSLMDQNKLEHIARCENICAANEHVHNDTIEVECVTRCNKNGAFIEDNQIDGENIVRCNEDFTRFIKPNQTDKLEKIKRCNGYNDAVIECDNGDKLSHVGRCNDHADILCESIQNSFFCENVQNGELVHKTENFDVNKCIQNNVKTLIEESMVVYNSVPCQNFNQIYKSLANIKDIVSRIENISERFLNGEYNVGKFFLEENACLPINVDVTSVNRKVSMISKDYPIILASNSGESTNNQFNKSNADISSSMNTKEMPLSISTVKNCNNELYMCSNELSLNTTGTLPGSNSIAENCDREFLKPFVLVLPSDDRQSLTKTNNCNLLEEKNEVIFEDSSTLPNNIEQFKQEIMEEAKFISEIFPQFEFKQILEYIDVHNDIENRIEVVTDELMKLQEEVQTENTEASCISEVKQHTIDKINKCIVQDLPENLKLVNNLIDLNDTDTEAVTASRSLEEENVAKVVDDDTCSILDTENIILCFDDKRSENSDVTEAVNVYSSDVQGSELNLLNSNFQNRSNSNEHEDIVCESDSDCLSSASFEIINNFDITCCTQEEEKSISRPVESVKSFDCEVNQNTAQISTDPSFMNYSFNTPKTSDLKSSVSIPSSMEDNAKDCSHSTVEAHTIDAGVNSSKELPKNYSNEVFYFGRENSDEEEKDSPEGTKINFPVQKKMNDSFNTSRNSFLRSLISDPSNVEDNVKDCSHSTVEARIIGAGVNSSNELPKNSSNEVFYFGGENSNEEEISSPEDNKLNLLVQRKMPLQKGNLPSTSIETSQNLNSQRQENVNIQFQLGQSASQGQNHGCRKKEITYEELLSELPHVDEFFLEETWKRIGGNYYALKDFIAEQLEEVADCGSQYYTLLSLFPQADSKFLQEMSNTIGDDETALKSFIDKQLQVNKTDAQYETLLSMFPQANSDYLRKKCNEIGNDEVAMRDFIVELLNENEYSDDYHTLLAMFPDLDPAFLRETVEKIGNDEEAMRMFVAEQLEEVESVQFRTLLAVLPDADPEYLQEMHEKLGKNEESMKIFLLEALENKDYPTRESYLKRQELNALKRKYNEELNVQEFLDVFPDPWNHFRKNVVKNEAVKRHAISYLEKRYRKIPWDQIESIFKESSFNLTVTCENLDAWTGDFALERTTFQHAVPDTEDIPVQFLQEVAFIENKEKMAEYLQLKEREKKEAFELAKANGELLECQTCFDNELMDHEVSTCPEGHIFCKDCIRRSAEVAIGNGETKFLCPLYSVSCQAEFSLRVIQTVLKPIVFSRMLQRRQREEVEAAGIQELESCPFCDFATIPPLEDKIFTCLNPECMRDSCRKCKRPSHIPLRCAEVESKETKIRTFIEDRMTDALIRTCWKCKKKFIKESGCNKMTCGCGALMCYVCRQPVKDYTHFNGEGGTDFEKCPLYGDIRVFHDVAVQEEGERAKKEVIANNPGVELKHDPTVIQNLK